MHPTAKRAALWRRAGLGLLLLLTLAAPLWHIHVIDGHMPLRHNDLIGRWVGARFALHGHDPYSPSVLRDIQIAYYGRPLTPADHVDAQAFLYPATIVPAIAPLSLLAWPAAALMFLLLTVILLILGFWLCLCTIQVSWSVRTRALVVLLAFFSWPVVWGLRLLQPTMPVLALVLIAWFLLARGHRILPGVLLALTTVKPQLVLPLLVWLLLWAALQRSWRFIAAFTATLALLLWTTHAILPGWLAKWRLSLHNYDAATASAAPLAWVFGHWIGLAGTLAIVGPGILFLWRLRHAPADSDRFGLALGLVLSVTLGLLPTHLSMAYNQVLLLPGTLLLAAAHPMDHLSLLARRVTLACVMASFVAVFIAIAGETFFGPSSFWDGVPCRFLLLPAIVTIALTLLAAEALRGAPVPVLEPQQPSPIAVA